MSFRRRILGSHSPERGEDSPDRVSKMGAAAGGAFRCRRGVCGAVPMAGADPF